MSALGDWDWSLRIFDAAYLLDPDGNNVEALYRDVGSAGHGAPAALR